VIPAAEVAALSEQELFALCVDRIRSLDAKARAAWNHSRHPAPP
jgi:hypothetical protein